MPAPPNQKRIAQFICLGVVVLSGIVLWLNLFGLISGGVPIALGLFVGNLIVLWMMR